MTDRSTGDVSTDEARLGDLSASDIPVSGHAAKVKPLDEVLAPGGGEAAPAKTPRPTSYIPSLDGFRAVAVAVVFAAHAHIIDIFPGGYGVTVFFFLSGFLITTLLRRELDKTNRIDLKHFYIRRTLRISPPLIITLLVAVLLCKAGLTPGEVNFKVLLAQMFFLGNFAKLFEWPYVDGTGVVWSLAVEEHFYLVYPLVFILATRFLSLKTLSHVLKVVCLAVLAWRYVLLEQFDVIEQRITYMTDTRIDSIAFGCILALEFNPVVDRDSEKRVFESWPVLWVALIVTLLSILARDEYFQNSIRYTIQGIALMPIFTMAILHPGSPLFRLLNTGPMKLIGLLSYTIYLSHFVAIKAMEWAFPSLHEGSRLEQTGLLLIAVAVSLAYSYAMYRIVEKPLASLRKKFR